MNMAQIARAEGYIPPTERKYCYWLDAVEKRMGHAVTDESAAWDLYQGKYSVEEAAVELARTA